MKLSQMFPSDYLKSDDIGNSVATVRIQDVTIEKMGDGAMKPVMSFIGKDKKMVLNKTNANVIGYLYGDDTDGWSGKSIQIRVEPVQGPNGPTKGLRVIMPTPGQPTQQETQAPPPETQVQDDDIPF